MKEGDMLGEMTGEGTVEPRGDIDGWFLENVKPINIRKWSKLVNLIKTRIYNEVKSVEGLSQGSKDRLLENAHDECRSIFMFSSQFLRELEKHENAIDFIHACADGSGITRNDIESRLNAGNLVDVILYALSVNGISGEGQGRGGKK